jgi:hypothetical protein
LSARESKPVPSKQKLFALKRFEGPTGETICFVDQLWAYSEADALEIARLEYHMRVDFAEEVES